MKSASRWLGLVPPALTAVALVYCYFSTLRGMVDQWSTDADMTHGFAVPLVVAWIVWNERRRWQQLPAEFCWWGLALLVAGAVIHTVAELGAGLFAGSIAFVISVTGAALLMGGAGRLRVWVFPLLLSLFMLPKLAIVYNQVTLPLQLLASRLSVGILWMTGIAASRQGNILTVSGHQLLVSEACSGIRYLLPFCFLAVVFAYLADPKPWMRIALMVTAAPISMLANAVRVAAAGYFPSLLAPGSHEGSGVLVFVLCLAALIPARSLFNAVHTRYQRHA
jgi:exosortase